MKPKDDLKDYMDGNKCIGYPFCDCDKVKEEIRRIVRQQTAQEIFEDLFNALKYNYKKEEEACCYFTDIEKIKQKYLKEENK